MDGPGLLDVQKRMAAIYKEDFNEQELYEEEEEADKATVEHDEEEEADPEDSNNWLIYIVIVTCGIKITLKQSKRLELAWKDNRSPV